MTSFYELDLPNDKGLSVPPQSIGLYDAILPAANTADTPQRSTTALDSSSAPFENNSAQAETKQEALPSVAPVEANNELSNFAQSLLYSSLGRPAAAITQMVDSIFPDVLPHLELVKPPSNSSIGGFLGDFAGNAIDLAFLSRFAGGTPAAFGTFRPMIQAGSIMMDNSLLTPVALAPGESLWNHKLESAGLAVLLGAAGRGVIGKGFPDVSPMRADMITYGLNAFSTATSDAFFPHPDSTFKQTDVPTTEQTANASGV